MPLLLELQHSFANGHKDVQARSQHLSLISVMLFENAAEKSHDPMPRFAAARVLACKFIFKSDRDDSITYTLHSTILDSWISNASMAFYSAAAAAAMSFCCSSSSTPSPRAIRTFRPARSTFRRRILRGLNG